MVVHGGRAGSFAGARSSSIFITYKKYYNGASLIMQGSEGIL